MKKAAIILMLVTIFSKILGFGRDITLSYFYGASNISDAYLISTTIPNSVFSIVGAGITTGFIPIYTRILNKNGVNSANNFMSNLINILLLVVTMLILFMWLFSEEIVSLFASGFEDDTLKLATDLTRISLISIYFTGLVHIFSGFLQVNGKYTITAFIAVPMNLIMMFFIYISFYNNILLLAIGTVLSIISQYLLLLPSARKSGFKYRAIINFKDEDIKKLFLLSVPIMLGVGVNEINVLVDRTIASRVIEGGISALTYSHRVTGIIQGIFVMSIVTVMFPNLTKFAATENMKEFKKVLRECIGSVNLLVIPATFGIMFFSETIIQLLYGRGAFEQEAIILTSNSLFFYSIGILGFGLRQVISKAFYALEDTKTPMINAAIALIINIVLNIILSIYFGIGGIALATSIAATICTILLIISLKRKIGPIGLKKVSFSFLKISLASFVMGIFSKFLYNILINHLNTLLTFLIVLCFAFLIYFIMIYLLKVKETLIVMNLLRKRN